MPDDIQTLRRILHDNRTIAVVGLSANWYRPSFFAAKYILGDFRGGVAPLIEQQADVNTKIISCFLYG